MASSNFGCPRIFFIQLFPNWTACSPITYTNTEVLIFKMAAARYFDIFEKEMNKRKENAVALIIT